MSNFFIDTHCHLDLFSDIQTSVIQENNLPIKTITVTNSPDFFNPNTQLFSNSKNIRVALGFHPELVAKFHDKIELFYPLIDKTKYIGEIGLDGSKSFESSFDLQKLIFESILKILKYRQNKIISVHSRGAEKITIETLNKYLKNTTNKVILHWFSGNITNLKSAFEAGYYFSVNHKMTQSKSGQEVIKNIPIDRLLTETDAPFTFDRRIRNRIDSLELCVLETAKIIGCDETFLKQQIYENFKLLLS